MQKTLQMKRALRTTLLIMLLSVAGMTKTYASYDFSAVCETGQTLYYNIIDAANHFVALTYPGTDYYNGWSGYTEPSGDIVLPENVQYINVTYSVTEIGSYAFYGCHNLTGSLTIPNSVTTISNDAFHFCSGFTGALTIPNSVTTIGDAAFCKCGCSGNLTIPNSVTSIGEYAFTLCHNFTGNLTIPNSVTTLGMMAFSGCDGLTGSLTISNSLTTISPCTFQYCNGLTGSLTIPNSVTTIGHSAFINCSGFTGILTIPNSMITIEFNAFAGCSGLTGSLTIPTTVTTIGDYAFYDCSGFTDITSLATEPPIIGNEAFSGILCTTLTVPCRCNPVYEASEWHNYFTTIIEDCTGLEEDGENIISLYPNPTTSKVNIEAEDLKHITICNQLGQTIYEGNASGDTFEYDFGKHEDGVYLIHIETAIGGATKRVIIRK